MAVFKSSFSRYVRAHWKLLLVVFTPLLLLPLPLFSQSMESRGAYIMIVMSVFWISEALPLAVTSLLPTILAPLMGIMTSKEVCVNYFKDVVVLFFGGIVAALAIERWNLHKRIALSMLMVCGTTSLWLMLSVMLPSWFLSMWISNTATTTMMVPIVSAILDQFSGDSRTEDGDEFEVVELEEIEKPSKDDDVEVGISGRADKSMRTGMILCVAYASTCGGIATLTGTGPNFMVKGIVDRLFGPEAGLTFGTWMAFAAPLSFICLAICWLWLHTHFFGFRQTFLHFRMKSPNRQKIRQLLRRQYNMLGPVTFPEWATLALFLALVFLWLFRNPEFFPGWGDVFPPGYVSDSTAAMFIAFLLFVVPSEVPKFKKGEMTYIPLMDWETVSTRFPWHIMVLFGGGFALADVCEKSGLTAYVVGYLIVLEGLPRSVIALVISIVAAAVTEITSNTAVATLILPIIADLAIKIDIHPLYLMIPATVSCSFAFMLPTATPPNAVAFSQGNIKITDMIKAGSLLNLLCLVVLMLALNTWTVPIFHMNSFPDWANRTRNDTISQL